MSIQKIFHNTLCFSVTTFLFLSVFVWVCFVGSGCRNENKPDDLPTLYPCEITVIQDGKPLSEAMVLFFPLNGNLRFAIGGKTNQNGILTPQIDGKWNGVPEGEYRISVSK
ncbi:MAG: hypothetical protein LBE12_03400 [Planctomycetaceae bacterium]|jgi:hypothetical protein|nr:hypothetical protein [Planctomycetaceae bacterium]